MGSTKIKQIISPPCKLCMQVQQMRSKHLQLNKTVMSIWDCCELLNQFVDESDPDLDEPQIEHLLQTAEAIRKDHPDEDWFHLTGLIHGKKFLKYCIHQ